MVEKYTSIRIDEKTKNILDKYCSLKGIKLSEYLKIKSQEAQKYINKVEDALKIVEQKQEQSDSILGD